MPLQLRDGARVAPLSSEGVGVSERAAETSAAGAQRSERGANPLADAAGPDALSARPGTVSRGDNSSQDGDSRNSARHEPPSAAGEVAATTSGEGSERRSPQSGEMGANVPGQGTVPAGLLWSDFGGGREAGEDAEETASREFAEESFGMFHGVRLESDSVARSQVR